MSTTLFIEQDPGTECRGDQQCKSYCTNIKDKSFCACADDQSQYYDHDQKKCVTRM